MVAAARSSVQLLLAEAEAELQEPTDRDAVGQTLIDFARGRCSVAVLLMIRRGEATGWLGSVPGPTATQLQEYRMKLDQPSMLFALREGVPYYRGPLPHLPAHDDLRAMLGEQVCTDILATPLRVRGRLVGALITAGGDARLSPQAVEEFQLLALKASMALELLILRQKLTG